MLWRQGRKGYGKRPVPGAGEGAGDRPGVAGVRAQRPFARTLRRLYEPLKRLRSPTG